MTNSKTRQLIDLQYSAVLNETEDAILFEFDTDREIWLPRSQIEFDRDNKTVTAPQWLIEEKQLEAYAV